MEIPQACGPGQVAPTRCLGADSLARGDLFNEFVGLGLILLSMKIQEFITRLYHLQRAGAELPVGELER
jgi:hypothetical protein